MKDGVFHKDPMRDDSAKKDGCHSLYINIVTLMLRKRFKYAGKHFHITSEERTALSRGALPRITTEYIQAYYEEAKKLLTRTCSLRKVWINGNEQNKVPLLGFWVTF